MYQWYLGKRKVLATKHFERMKKEREKEKSIKKIERNTRFLRGNVFSVYKGIY